MVKMWLKVALNAAKLPKVLLQWHLEKYNYGSGKPGKLREFFLLLCGHPGVFQRAGVQCVETLLSKVRQSVD